MQEIEFRAWDKECGFFRDEENVFVNQSGGIYREDEIAWYADRYEIELFTRLKDKDGKKIYRGDVVLYRGISIHGKVTQTKGVVKYSDDDAGFIVENSGGSLAFAFFGINGIKDYKVIGNIHENPELGGL